MPKPSKIEVEFVPEEIAPFDSHEKAKNRRNSWRLILFMIIIWTVVLVLLEYYLSSEWNIPYISLFLVPLFAGIFIRAETRYISEKQKYKNYLELKAIPFPVAKCNCRKEKCINPNCI